MSVTVRLADSRGSYTVYHFENNVEIPLVTADRATCEKSLLASNATGATQNLFGTMQLPKFQLNETSSDHDFLQNLAAFLITRGDFSFFGAVGGGDASVFSPVSGSRWFAECVVGRAHSEPVPNTF